jgi:hypothetical protein
MMTLAAVNGPPGRCPSGLDNSFRGAALSEPRKCRNYQFRIRTESGNIVNTYARGYDPENAKYHMWKQYPNAVIVEMREK